MCIGEWTASISACDLEEANQCILVIIGATVQGRKKLVVLANGFRESEPSWKDVLLDLKRRDLLIDPGLAVGDEASDFQSPAASIRGDPHTALLGA